MSTETTETKLTRLLSGLIDRTDRRLVRWEETAEESMFRAQLHHGLVRIGEDHDHRGGRAYTIWLLDNEGRIVEEFDGREGTEEFRLMQELYRLARRSARPAADLLDRMLDEVAPRPGRPNP